MAYINIDKIIKQALGTLSRRKRHSEKTCKSAPRNQSNILQSIFMVPHSSLFQVAAVTSAVPADEKQHFAAWQLR